VFSWLKRGKAPAAPIDLMIVGLGNPGSDYDNTRHNIGFSVIDKLAAHHGINVKKLKFQSLYGEGTAAGRRVILLKPQTYMNKSGESVRQVVEFYKLTPGRVLVIFDDASLSLGTLRLRAKGSDGGHNGIKNIIYQLRTDTFLRLKIGIGAPPHKEYDMADWVLSRFSEEERKIADDAVARSLAAVESVLAIGIEAGMNQFN
jgi:PTH1 family peptidyl-tRNA hydrolase